jgi:inner membrane protein
METVLQTVWSKSKLLVKGGVIALIVLILQIPALYVQVLVEEREQRQKEATSEISSKWAARQTFTGPVITLPFWQEVTDTQNRIQKVRQYAYFLPDDLSIQAQVTPEERHRGIYKVMLYTSQLKVNGKFDSVAFDKLSLNPSNIIWTEAFVQMGLSDIRGLNQEVSLNWNGQSIPFSAAPTAQSKEDMLQAPLHLTGPQDLRNFVFSTSFSINGSEQLLFAPTGRQTNVSITASWPHPSFTGSMLPQQSAIKDSGFTATWKSMSFKRSFPQQWTGEPGTLSEKVASAAFGADLFVPVNGYQKTMRSVKYAALCILLTFAAFFLIETNNRKSVHPFQYGLIGAALVLFYILLLSFSEYIGFNPAYGVASVFTIGLIAWFVKGLLASSKLAVLLSVILTLLYGYVFTILQLQDFALILGSLGLFLTLAVIMYYSRKIQW